MTSEFPCPKEPQPLLMIEYPGIVQNLDKALDTMGGMDSIDHVFKSEKDRLELKFRRADPLAHPAYGDRVTKKCLVLRIKKLQPAGAKPARPTRRKTSGQQSASEEAKFDVQVLGKIQTGFCFETLAEFQWLPMQRTNLVETIKSDDLSKGITLRRTPESLNPEYCSILDDILPIKNPFDGTMKTFNPDAPLLILPAIFSRFDTPRDIHQPQPKFRNKEMREEYERQQRLSIIGRTRKKRSTMSYLLNFGDPIPQEAPERLIKERETLSPQEHSIVPRLRECFEKQKIWSKAGICYELNCTLLDVKYTLPLVAYHWLTGPFRTMWVKYGYDPHKDPSSKIMQTLDFRVKNPHDQQEYSRRSMHQYQLPMRKNNPDLKGKKQLDLKSALPQPQAVGTSSQPMQILHHPATGTIEIETIDPEDASTAVLKDLAITEALCRFRKDLIPPARQLSYQLKDIEIDEVQAIIHQNDGKEPEICTEKDGWLEVGSVEKIRKLMTKSLQETLENLTTQMIEA